MLEAVGMRPGQIEPRNRRWKKCVTLLERGAESEEKRELASDLDTVMVDSLKALDLIRPIRQADMPRANGAALTLALGYASDPFA